jgi:NDP-sugar pyrophosphorylase family protein
MIYSQQLNFQRGANERAAGVYAFVNEDGKRVCNEAENLRAKSMYPVAILAGGLATRLRPITEIPKALVDVGGEPFIAHQLRYLRAQGIAHVVMCVGYLGTQIQDIIGDGKAYGLKVEYSFDGDPLLGTGGALYKALPLLGDTFFVLYGDTHLPVDYQKIATCYRAQSCPILMTVLRNGNQWDKSNVCFKDGEVREYNKKNPRPDMHYIDYGLSLVSSSIFSEVTAGTYYDLSDIYHKVSMGDGIAGYEVFDRFYEIGTHEGLAETIAFFKE